MFGFGKKDTKPAASKARTNAPKAKLAKKPSTRIHKHNEVAPRRVVREKKVKPLISNISKMPVCPAVMVVTGESYTGDLVIDGSKFVKHMVIMDKTMGAKEKVADIVYAISEGMAAPVVSTLRATLRKYEYKIGKVYEASQEIVDTYHHNLNQGMDAASSEATKFADSLLVEGLEFGSSDIHISVDQHRANVCYRIDGKLIKKREIDPQSAARACVVMYGTFTASDDSDGVQFNPRKLQNARFERIINDISIACRFASTPKTPQGFKVVLRILKQDEDDTGEPVPFTKFGYEAGHVALMELSARRSVGLTVVAGVTGSGKSTTLANMCKQIDKWNRSEKSIYTVEDPPEYVISCAVQIPVIRTSDSSSDDSVNPFALALRGCMRLDPDVIMVGEIRDRDTAGITKGAVTSGHQVITSIHASSWIEIVSRLQYYGVGLADMAAPSFFSSLIYQKLLPIMCQSCSVPIEDAVIGKEEGLLVGSDVKILTRLGKVADDSQFGTVRIQNNRGCSKCGHKGTVGRTVAAEVAVPDRRMLEAIAKGDLFQAYDFWRENYNGTGVVGMKACEHGLRRVMTGKVCPLVVESEFENFELQHAKEDHKITRAEVEDMVASLVVE